MDQFNVISINAPARRVISNCVTSGIVNAFILYAVLQVAINAFGVIFTPYDDTDPAGGRSGLRILIDCGTGVQYVETGSGGLTPRVGADGTILRKPC